MTAKEVRQRARANRWLESTRGAAPGKVQCNIVLLPGRGAQEFHRWCEANPSVAPLLAVSEPGDYALSSLGDDIDIRRDLPAYRIIHDGRNIAFKGDILELWKDDWQAFAFGCSFSLEDALRSGGIPLSYEQRGFGGAIYRTNLETVPSGSFSGPLIVSMRPIHRDRINDVLKISENLPGLHGLPVQVGNPAQLGVDLYSPIETLGKMSLVQDEEPVFWACGVTAHLALENAGLPIAVTHVSSRMLVTDIPIDSSLMRRVAFDD